MTTRITGGCEAHNVLKLQTAVKAANGRFISIFTVGAKSYYSIAFGDDDGYERFNEVYDRLTTPIKETTRKRPWWRRLIGGTRCAQR